MYTPHRVTAPPSPLGECLTGAPLVITLQIVRGLHSGKIAPDQWSLKIADDGAGDRFLNFYHAEREGIPGILLLVYQRDYRRTVMAPYSRN